MSLKKTGILILIILLIDQFSKIYIKTHFMLNESVEVFNWFRITFVENEGMAWGARIPGSYGKLILSLFRIVAVIFIGYLLIKVIREKRSKYLIIGGALIFAGALGNIIDSVFYGIIFDDSYNQVATLFSKNTYAPLFYGKVVDMLYFPLWKGYLPEWLPFWGGDYFVFFEPVFNIADSAITIGFILLLIFNKKAFPPTK